MTPMPITEELSRYIRERIARFADEADPASRLAAPKVAEHEALPVLFDWTATFALTPDGKLVVWSDEGDFEGIQTVEDPNCVRASLASAAVRYPPLAALIPPRPSDAPDCPHCDGSGRLPGLPENVVCACAGLGWLDPPATRRRGWLRAFLESWGTGLRRGRPPGHGS